MAHRRHLVRAFRVAASVTLLCSAALAPLHAQRLVERTPNLPNAVAALPGMLETSLTNRFSRAPGTSGIAGAATFDVAFGMPLQLPLHWTTGLRFAPASALDSDEWELYQRLGLLHQTTGAPLDVLVTGAYNLSARSIDAELTAAHRLGPLRMIGTARGITSPRGAQEARFALGGGVAWQPMPRRSPLALMADVATLVDRRTGEEPAWSAGVQTGLPHSTLSLSLYATNARSTTLQGTSTGGRRTRWGIELNTPVEFIGMALGVYASREHAQRAVETDVDAVPSATVRMRDYLYAPMTLTIRAGDTVEWVNDDDVVHTVTSENAGFDSRGIQRGERWRARFTEPGVYPYYCGPHPFMKGVVVVR
jgi:plastocyanin